MERELNTSSLPLARVTDFTVPATGRAVLHEVSIAVYPGQIVALAGPSGGGKTTLLHVLSGERRGSGERVFTTDRRLLFPQDARAALNPALKIARQLRLIPGLESREVTRQWLAKAGLPNPDAVLGRYPPELSGGECQRVIWAIVLSREPNLLMLDEPTSAVEEEREMALLQIAIHAVVKRGGAIVVATHSPSVVQRHCSHIVLMDQGRVAEYGPIDALRTQAAHPHARAMLKASG